MAEKAQRMTVPRFMALKSKGRKISMLTAYDFATAKLLDGAGVDALLVGDSLSMVVQGHETPRQPGVCLVLLQSLREGFRLQLLTVGEQVVEQHRHMIAGRTSGQGSDARADPNASCLGGGTQTG